MKLLPLLFVILIVCAILPDEASCDQSELERKEENFKDESREIVKRSCKKECSGSRRTKKCMQKCNREHGHGR
uniref:Potassium channel toxin kappa-KTx 5.1 n=1 Tax=Heterometrus laoticus TaxID=217256 RepID=KKX51_HETLA|nr:RecName: Full=Potassium channel toxin kappa-KTx 5.1; AltName: Full=HelaTx1; Flags: Precursor [Heterometrus laoticus]AFB73757.1 Kv1.x potassium channel blocker precursor [Heterometrus laoticus]